MEIVYVHKSPQPQHMYFSSSTEGSPLGQRCWVEPHGVPEESAIESSSFNARSTRNNSRRWRGDKWTELYTPLLLIAIMCYRWRHRLCLRLGS